MSSKNFRDLLIERQRLIHRKSIYTEVVEHLTKFLDTDMGPAKLGIRSEGDSLVVPQENVEEERDALQELVGKIQEQIDKIDASVVADEKEQQQHDPTEQAGKKEVGEEAGKKGKAKKSGSN